MNVGNNVVAQQILLKSLIGLSAEEAEQKVLKAGYEPRFLQRDGGIFNYVENRINLFLLNFKVVKATIG